MPDIDLRLALRIVAAALAVCGCSSEAGKPAAAAPASVPAAGAAPTGRVERASIHPDLAEFSFTLEGDESDSVQAVRRIEIRSGSEEVPIQTLEGFETETPIRPAEPLLEVLDMDFDGYRDLRIIEFLPAGPDVPYLNWLYDPPAGRFVRAEELDAIPSPAFDEVAQRIRSTWRNGAARYGIDTYQWVDGRPVATRKELREYLEPGVYERTVSEPVGEGWVVVGRETVRE